LEKKQVDKERASIGIQRPHESQRKTRPAKGANSQGERIGNRSKMWGKRGEKTEALPGGRRSGKTVEERRRAHRDKKQSLGTITKPGQVGNLGKKTKKRIWKRRPDI